MTYLKFTSRLNPLKTLTLPMVAAVLIMIAAPDALAQTCIQNCLRRDSECYAANETKCKGEATNALRLCEEAGGSSATCQASYDNAYRNCKERTASELASCGCRKCVITGITRPDRTYYCDCPPGDDDEELACGIRNYEGECTSPILIDINGDGFRLTNVDSGVLFDLRGTGSRLHTAWTVPDSDDAWLVLDRNNNGAIDDGTELFGNFTPQPETCNKNGFLALAVFDNLANGGNGDGIISSADGVFNRLRLWQDRNHNGISESDELLTLTAAEVLWLDLDFKPSKRVDEHGNGFRYRAKVKDATGGSVGRWAWDVWLMNRFVQ